VAHVLQPLDGEAADAPGCSDDCDPHCSLLLGIPDCLRPMIASPSTPCAAPLI
jgi:hypothetical protein